MKRVVIEAYNGIGKEKKLAGKRTVDAPENLDEALEIEKKEDPESDPEATVLDYYWSSKTIEIQRQIRSGTTMTAKRQLAALQAYARANPDGEVAKTLKALEISLGGQSETATGSPEGEKEKA